MEVNVITQAGKNGRAERDAQNDPIGNSYRLFNTPNGMTGPLVTANGPLSLGTVCKSK